MEKPQESHLTSPSESGNSVDPNFTVAQIAQSVEQSPEKACVGGSIPSLGTISKFIRKSLTNLLMVLRSELLLNHSLVRVCGFPAPSPRPYR